MIITLFLGFFWLGFISIYFYAKQVYSRECSSIPHNEYKQWMIIPVGLILLDSFPVIQSHHINYSLLQLYGKPQYTWRKRMYEAERLSIMFLLLFFTITIVLMLNIKSLAVNNMSSIDKNNFGEGDQTHRLYYDLNFKDNRDHKMTEGITFIIPEMEPTHKEVIKEIAKIKEELPNIMLGENKSLDHVDHPLNLQRSLSDRVYIAWVSEQDQLLQNNGQIRYNNLLKEGEQVTLNANIECYGVKDSVQYQIKLYKKTLEPSEKKELINDKIKLILSRQALTDSLDKTITLPKAFNDYGATVRWYDGEKRIKSIRYLILGLIISVTFYWLKQYELKTKVYKRQEEILRAFPGFVNKFALLMNAGMTFSKSWEKIAGDYLRLKSSSGKEIVLYEEMLLTIEDIQKGISEIKAYEAFGQRCKIPEVLRFSATVMQNIKKGSYLLINAMQQQAKEAMTMREDLARKKGEKASTKLVLPMGIMLIAILIIVITPALISLKV